MAPPPPIEILTPASVEFADKLPTEAILILVGFGALVLTATALGVVRFLNHLSLGRRAVYSALVAFFIWAVVILLSGADLEFSFIVSALLGFPAVAAGAIVFFRELGRESTQGYEAPKPIDWHGHLETAGGFLIASPLLAALAAIGFSVYNWLRHAKWPDMSIAAFTGALNSDWIGFNLIVNGLLDLHMAFPLLAIFAILILADVEST